MKASLSNIERVVLKGIWHYTGRISSCILDNPPCVTYLAGFLFVVFTSVKFWKEQCADQLETSTSPLPHPTGKARAFEDLKLALQISEVFPGRGGDGCEILNFRFYRRVRVCSLMTIWTMRCEYS